MDAITATLSTTEAAKRLKVKPDTVNRRRRVLGLPAPKRGRPHDFVWTPQMDEIVATLTMPAAAKRLGVTPDKVYRRRRAIGLPPRKPGRPPKVRSDDLD